MSLPNYENGNKSKNVYIVTRPIIQYSNCPNKYTKCTIPHCFSFDRQRLGQGTYITALTFCLSPPAFILWQLLRTICVSVKKISIVYTIWCTYEHWTCHFYPWLIGWLEKWAEWVQSAEDGGCWPRPGGGYPPVLAGGVGSVPGLCAGKAVAGAGPPGSLRPRYGPHSGLHKLAGGSGF